MEQQLDEINEEIRSLNLEWDKYPKHSSEYRNMLTGEIELLQKKQELLKRQLLELRLS